VKKLILKTAGNTGGAATPLLKPHEVAKDFEFRGIEAVKDPKSPIHSAFEEFAQGSTEGTPADILSILHTFSSSSPVPSVPKASIEGGSPPPGNITRSVKPGVAKDLTTDVNKKRIIDFYPRDRHRRRTREIPKNGKFFTQGMPPEFKKPSDMSVKTPAVDVAATQALVHGIAVAFVPEAFKNGFISSAYMREGPFGKYSRQSDKEGGGGLGVYTRAVGKNHTKWPTHGKGVGSGEAKIQIVLDPKILTSDAVWRHSSTDLRGNLPGGQAAKRGHVGNKLDSFDLWEQQSEVERNATFNRSINDKNEEGLGNNEQLFWEQIPLKGNVIAIICKTKQQQAEIIAAIGGNAEEGYIMYDGQNIPVIVTEKDDMLVGTLNSNK
jgi:hypothetical protein